ncbi:MAG: NTP transferase domain-containing protein [Sphingobacteriia bacterium]|nr:NTP transferase domain-containing protein [Sphingobacteriia bacterium]
MFKNVIILAGGRGTRISQVTGNIIPKPMIKFDGIPFLEILCNSLISQKNENIYLSIGFLHEVITEHFSNYKFKDQIYFNIEEELLGTGGAIVDTINKFNIKGDILALNGDSLNVFDVKKFYEFHKENNFDITILSNFKEDTSRYGNLIFENNKITGFKEKQSNVSGYINSGVYAINKKVFDSLNFEKKFSFENDFLMKYTNDLNVGIFKNDGFFIDFGVPEDYEKALIEIPLYAS